MQQITLDKVGRFIRENRMIPEKCVIIAGVSGGNDSMAMLHLLKSLQEKLNFGLRVVHVNHGIRGDEAKRDQNIVEDICRQWDIPCNVYQYDIPDLAARWKLGEEETGRIARRQAFDTEKKKFITEQCSCRIALAHNKNDLAETMLHHLARGTGLRGLCSLKPVNGEVMRPLLCLERREIDDYVERCRIPSVLDSTNLEDEYTRNRIRRHILPVLEKEVNAKTIEHMAETARIFAQAEEFLTEEAERLIRGCQEPDGSYCLRDAFFEKKQILRSYGIRGALENLSGQRRDISQIHISQVENLYSCQVSKQISLPYEMEAVRGYNGVIIRKKKTENLKNQEYKQEESVPLPAEGEIKTAFGCFGMRTFSYSGEKILEKKYTKWFDCAKINSRLSVRTRQKGDYLVISKDGGRKKLTRCMIDDRVPKETRDQIPLIADGEEILWIVGGRISERYKITSCTRNILEITYQGGTRI